MEPLPLSGRTDGLHYVPVDPYITDPLGQILSIRLQVAAWLPILGTVSQDGSKGFQAFCPWLSVEKNAWLTLFPTFF